MLALFEHEKDRITTFRTFAEIRKEIFVNYGVNGTMTLLQFYRVVSLSTKAIATIDAYFEKLLTLPNVLLCDKLGGDYTNVYVNKTRGTIDHEDKSLLDFHPSRFYMLGNVKVLDWMGQDYDYQIRPAYHTYAADVDYNQGFIQRIQRACTVDSMLSDLEEE